MKALLEKGVKILHPESTWIDDSVSPDRLSPGSVIYPGCRISGDSTSIGPGCVIGEEAPATLQNCQLDENVRLKGGFFAGSVFLRDAAVASGAQLRPSCILEEQVVCGHNVGLKDTVLFPFVSLGSQINFCDCLLAGGTGKNDFSEVGSSFVHFNYSPKRHKATPSMFGDVTSGVALGSPPVFLGGNGGVVGPVKVEYGTVTAAGTILRNDISSMGMLVSGTAATLPPERHFDPDSFVNILPKIEKNIYYIASLHALREWYRHVRILFDTADYQARTTAGAVECISKMIDARVKHLGELTDRIADAEKNTPSDEKSNALFTEQFRRNSGALTSECSYEGSDKLRSRLTGFLHDTDRSDYVSAIQGLAASKRETAVSWLESVVSSVEAAWQG